jgi:hypothetical protein
VSGLDSVSGGRRAGPDARTATAFDGHDRALRVAVLAGGRSSEHEVSLASGEAVRDGLLAAGHDVVWVEIARDGTWTGDGETLSLTPGAGLLGADVAFPALHGPFGEDGTLQGMLETLAVPYVGSGVAASAVSLDKVLFKELMGARGVPQVEFLGLRSVPAVPREGAHPPPCGRRQAGAEGCSSVRGDSTGFRVRRRRHDSLQGTPKSACGDRELAGKPSDLGSSHTSPP